MGHAEWIGSGAEAVRSEMKLNASGLREEDEL